MFAADAACYIAKEQGRNRAHLYIAEDANLIEQHSNTLWVSRLTQALDEDRFRPHHQAIVALRTGKAARPYYEVLLRLQEADGRLVEPMAFLPTAERYNLMPAIDRWVLREVVRGIAAVQQTAGPPPLFAVNLSERSLIDGHLPNYLHELLTSHGVPGDRLCLEIPAAAGSANISQMHSKITELKSRLQHFTRSIQ